ncbi:ERCC4 domain-containing protein [Xylaria bambusicola]|uniref:ERCC4 domain-containing protein n=1 Tax=Xylaria bambusicola TaxID=326684 RepID=UPI0020079042|nr:ERCC4 domain-containing protein [Xylaria bambusicola]KAI0517393.1 ERCC4 domain-containing protein [Xylaria bambusicola]
MPTEIISLLSSSPVRPSSASVVASFEQTQRPSVRMPPRAPNYTQHGLTEAESTKTATTPSFHTPSEPLAGTTHTSRHQVRSDDLGADGFLFLSDDFDITGDLEGTFYKKSPSPRGVSNSRKRISSPPLPRKAKALKTKSSDRESVQPISRERRTHLIEDIEFSSSPANFTSDTRRKAPPISSDLFVSSPIDQQSTFTAKSRSPRQHHNKIGGEATWDWPAELRVNQLANVDHEAHQSSKQVFIDLSSDPPDSPPRLKPQPSHSNSRSKATWDPISSSAPETHDVHQLLSNPSSTTRIPRPQPIAIPEDGPSDSEGLTDLENIDFSRTRVKTHSSSSRPTAPRAKQAVKKVVRATGEEKARGKREKAEAREAEKEQKRIEKERIREERALQKETEKALAEVNKLRTDKKVSTPEMIVDIPANINAGLKVQIQTLLGDLDVKHEIWNSTVENVVKWRRKVTAQFNKEMGFWEPTPMRIQEENHVLVIVQAPEFVKFVLGGEGHDLEAHVLHMKSKFPSAKTIYLIEGLNAWMRKNRNLLNRQFASAVRELGTNNEPRTSGQRRQRNNNQTQEYIDEDKIEDALLSLQVLHETLVHHTAHQVETAQWVAVFTQHISTIPYRKARDDSANAGFCMESGQVSTGDGGKDTYILMLQQIARVTPAIAYGIATKYESVTDLIRGFEEEGPLALAACRKSANKDGALTDRLVGPAVSKRLHKIFLGRDPTSTDI